LIVKSNGFYYDYSPTGEELPLEGKSPLVKFGEDLAGKIYFDYD
jgi:hypothetical protein